MRIGLLSSIAALAMAASVVPANAAVDIGPALSTPSSVLENALSCPDGFTHPDRNPVLLVQGTGTGPELQWGEGYAKFLPLIGRDWCMVALADRALADVQLSAERVVQAVRTMHRRTGRQVDMIGASQGAMEERWAVRWWPDVRANVNDLITLEGANQGIPETIPFCASGGCQAAVWQFTYGSKFMAALNKDPVPDGPSYTAIYSYTDTFMLGATPGTPLAWGQIPSPSSPKLSNILIQDLCPGREVEHAGSIIDAAEAAVALDALEHPGPAQLSRVNPSVCNKLFAPGVNPQNGAAAVAAVYLGAFAAMFNPTGPSWTDHEPAPMPYVTGTQ
jgi:hypothetical protein